jgi:UDP-N-acetylglucosamine 4-epimerase
MQAFRNNESPWINGDGNFSRDFTYVSNAVQANLLALFSEDTNAVNQVYNIACGSTIRLNEIVSLLNKLTGKQIAAEYGPVRTGDIPYSMADISKALQLLGYEPHVLFDEGLEKTWQWLATGQK